MSTASILNCSVCPTCNRRISTPRVSDKKLTEDIQRAESAIAVLAKYTGTGYFDVACQLEAQRLRRATYDHSLLWSIYRRRDKASGYGISLVKRA